MQWNIICQQERSLLVCSVDEHDYVILHEISGTKEQICLVPFMQSKVEQSSLRNTKYNRDY